MRPEQPTIALRNFFSGLAEYVFQTELGLADPPLVDYVSGLMSRFLRWDSLLCVRDSRGCPVGQVTEMVAEADRRIGDARRTVHRHIGDYTLFWVGVYPDSLRKLRGPAKKDYFVDYCAQGKRAYFLASRIEAGSDDEPPGDVLERLSVQFELCAQGLQHMRRQWESDADGGAEIPGPILVR